MIDFRTYYTIKMTEKYWGSYRYSEVPDFKIKFIMWEEYMLESFLQDSFTKFWVNSSSNGKIFISSILSKEYNELL